MTVKVYSFDSGLFNFLNMFQGMERRSMKGYEPSLEYLRTESLSSGRRSSPIYTPPNSSTNFFQWETTSLGIHWGTVT